MLMIPMPAWYFFGRPATILTLQWAGLCLLQWRQHRTAFRPAPPRLTA